MAFPSILASTTNQDINVSQSIQLPTSASLASGDLILTFSAFDGTPTISNTAGYTELLDVGGFAIMAKVSDGTESGGTVSISVSANEKGAHAAYFISGWGGTIATDIDISNNIGSGTTPDSPSLTAGGGSADILWFSAYARAIGTTGITSYPTNYILGQNWLATGTLGGDTVIGVAGRNLATATEDPGNFTDPKNSAWKASTVAIAPDGGGATPISATDSGSGTDSYLLSVGIAANDSGAGIDTPPLQAAINSLDVGSGLDSVVFAAAQILLDAAASIDNVPGVASLIGVADTGNGVETPVLNVTLAISELSAGVDTLSLLSETIKLVADTGSGLENLATSVRTLTVDTGAAVELPLITASLVAADVASAVEFIDLLTGTVVSALDSGSGQDSVLLSTLVRLPDSVSGNDATLLRSLLSAIDAAGGSDVVATYELGEKPIAQINFMLTSRGMAMTVKAPSLTFTFDGKPIDFQ